MARRSLLFRLLGVGALAASICVAVSASPASAKPAELNDNSLRSQLADIAATLKRETDRLASAVADASSEAKPVLEDWQTRAAKRLETWRDALSGRKDTLGTFSRDLDAAVEDWREAANQTWSRMHAATRDALNRFNAWLSGLRGPSHDDPFPV